MNNKKVAFFTEMGFNGKIPRTHRNMRTEFSWMVAFDADHYNLHQTPTQDYDLGIIIIPKKNPVFDINRIRSKCKTLATMQEGPQELYQDYTLENQINYLNILSSVDIILTHNEKDKIYFKGIFPTLEVKVLQSLMIEDSIQNLPKVERQNVMIGGNFVSWYGGMDSFLVASEINKPIYCPSMGRKQPGEESLVKHLPYLEWVDWIEALNGFRIGVHLMRTHAAGTFALNCSALGIPCIGYFGLDTQQILHPELTVEVGDLLKAKQLIKQLDTDTEFYQHCSEQTRELYDKHYSEEVFKNKYQKLY